MGWLQRASERLSIPESSRIAREELRDICEFIMKKTKLWKVRMTTAPMIQGEAPPYTSDVLARVVTSSVELDDKELFVEVYGLCNERTDLSIFHPVGRALSHFNLESLLPM